MHTFTWDSLNETLRTLDSLTHTHQSALRHLDQTTDLEMVWFYDYCF